MIIKKDFDDFKKILENKEKSKTLLRTRNWFYKLLFFQNPFKEIIVKLALIVACRNFRVGVPRRCSILPPRLVIRTSPVLVCACAREYVDEREWRCNTEHRSHSLSHFL